MKVKILLKKYSPEIFVLIIGILFGSFLMLSTFSESSNTLFISSKAWSDFASHIPLIRSFSLGSNFPPEYPLFPGEIIKYHFIFYAFVGLLERFGLSIDLALNIPSIFGFIFLVLMIYFFAKLIFKSRSVGILSVFFFLFNSSLTFVYYFKNNPLSFDSIRNIPEITNFQSFAPYDSGIVSAFWNLNIYTNQRHLALAFSISLFIIYVLIKPIFDKSKSNLKISIILGTTLGFSFFLHLAVLLMTGIVILSLGIFFSKIRKSCFLILIIAGFIALPQYLYLNSSEGFKMLLNPGYLVSDKLTFINFLQFWTYNLGLSIIFIFLGFIFSDWKQRKIFLSFVSLFIIGNLIQFSPEIAANHKFFNYFILIGNMFSAFALFILWKKNILFKPIVIVAILFMILGGILDFFPLYHDNKISIQDYKINLESKWILKNTTPDSLFLNTTYLYDPASLAGRKIFFGWPYFAWSQGYNTHERGEMFKEILGSKSKIGACNLLKENNIDYIEIKIQNPPDPNIPEISNVFNNEFIPQYKNNTGDYFIYSVKFNCI